MKTKKLVAFILAAFMAVGLITTPFSHVDAATATMKTSAKVEGLKVTAKTDTTISLKWNKLKNADGYKLYRSANKEKGYKELATLKGNNKVAVKIKKLKSNKVYYFKVKAYDKVDGKTVYSKFSKVLKVKTAAAKNNNSTEQPKTEQPKTTQPKTEQPKTTQPNNEAPKPAVDENKVVDYNQSLDFAETKTSLNNPDQGFYSSFRLSATPEGKRFVVGNVRDDKGNLNTNYNFDSIKNGRKLVQIRVDLSELSGKVNGKNKDYDLSQDALNDLDTLLKNAYDADKSVIIRFCYAPNFGSKADAEPSIEKIEKHIKDLSSKLNKYQDTITAIEAGMLGPWGEMHTSLICDRETGNPDMVAKSNKAVIDGWLNGTKKIPVLVRTPWRIYLYYSKNDANSYKTVSRSGEAMRLGMYNDALYASDGDSGTYIYGRQGETDWMSQNLANVPYGGETYNADSSLSNIEKCVPEMFKLHLSYLDYEYDQKVVLEKWQNSTYNEACGSDKLYYGETAYKYIEDHMGYRFVERSSKLSYNAKRDKLNVAVGLDNVGFGNLTKEKKVSLIFVELDANGKETSNKFESTNCATYSGEQVLKTSLEFQNGKISADKSYNVYVRVDNGSGKYAIRFANNLWNDGLQANKIGTIKAK